jgi:hypothetical protein
VAKAALQHQMGKHVQAATAMAVEAQLEMNSLIFK